MFKENRLDVGPNPPRVFELIQAISKKSLSRKDLRNEVEASGEGNYFGGVLKAAQDLELIALDDQLYKYVGPEDAAKSLDGFKSYVISKLPEMEGYLFYELSKAIFYNGEKILKRNKSLSDKSETLFSEISPRDTDMRAWRFWAPFLGFGMVSDFSLRSGGAPIRFIPNPAEFILSLLRLHENDLELDKPYTLTEVFDILCPHIFLVDPLSSTERQLNYSLSAALRTLHRTGYIQLEHVLDNKDQWRLSPTNEPLPNPKTQVTTVKVLKL